MAKLSSQAFVDALVRAGVISANDLPNIRKITIEVGPDPTAIMTVEYIGTDRLASAIGSTDWAPLA